MGMAHLSFGGHPDSSGADCHRCFASEPASAAQVAGRLKAGDEPTTGVSILDSRHRARGSPDPHRGQAGRKEEDRTTLNNAACHADNRRAKDKRESAAPEAVLGATKMPCGNGGIDAHVDKRWKTLALSYKPWEPHMCFPPFAHNRFENSFTKPWALLREIARRSFQQSLGKLSSAHASLDRFANTPGTAKHSFYDDEFPTFPQGLLLLFFVLFLQNRLTQKCHFGIKYMRGSDELVSGTLFQE